MNSSTLYHLLQKLPAEDRRPLRKFVASPYHNLRDDVQRLFQFLDAHLDNPAAVTIEAAHAATYPGQPFDHQQLRYCMSYLTAVIEQYLVVRDVLAEKTDFQLRLANAYRRLGLEKPTRRALERARSAQASATVQDASYFEREYQLEAEVLEFSAGQKRTAPRNLQQVNHSLDLSFLAKKLRQSSLALSHGAVANVAYDAGLLDLILDYLEGQYWLDEHPAIALYFYYYRAATTDDERYFSKLKNGMERASETLPEGELRALHFLAINFCIRQFNQGEERYLGEVFELYRSGLERGILLIDDKLSRFAFKNIAGIAIRLGEFGWTEDFIEKFVPKIELRHRRNYRDFVSAKLRYARRDLDGALLLLQNVEYEDVFLNLDAKVLLLKIYFELDETAVLDSFISSFQRFLNRQQELGYHREKYTNTLQFARRLLALNPFEKTEREVLRSEIEGAKTVGEREWLLERLVTKT